MSEQADAGEDALDALEARPVEGRVYDLEPSARGAVGVERSGRHRIDEAVEGILSYPRDDAAGERLVEIHALHALEHVHETDCLLDGGRRL